MHDSVFPFDQEVVWTPSESEVRQSNLVDFMSRHGLRSLAELERWAVRDPDWFWSASLAYLGIEFRQPWSRMRDTARGLPHTRWCVDGYMNITHNCLDKWVRAPDFDDAGRPSLIWEGEDGSVRTLTYRELGREVGRCANSLRRLGLGTGDVIGIYMPMVPETVIAFLAVLRIGAIALPLFSGFGTEALVSRLRAGEARALISGCGFHRREKWIDMLAVVDEVQARVPSLAHVLAVTSARMPSHVSLPASMLDWRALWSTEAAECPPAPTGAEDPCLLIYTSGTTGAPKGAVHTHCGFPVKAAQDMSHGFDVKRADVVFWHTDLGWMMGPWLILGTLLLGATMVIYDGAPDFPQADRIWALCARHGVTLLGLSPTLARALMRHGAGMVDRHDLSGLRAIGSTGSPWDPASWRWVFKHVLEARKPLLNYTGGTEISGGILGCSWTRPLKPCSFSGPLLGMEADVVDEEGESLTGQPGELVMRGAWIGMTRGFWKDAGRRYRQTYWSRWDHLWRHGDLAVRDAEGFWYLLGRSDDTMNVAGKRLGPAEFEQVLNGQPAVAEAAAVGVPDPLKGQRVICFCVLNPDWEGTTELGDSLLDAVARALGRPLRPADLLFVPGLPKTRNAKIMRRLLADIYLAEPLGDLSGLEDQSLLDRIAQSVAVHQGRGAVPSP